MKVTDLSSFRIIETPEELPDKKIEIAITSVKAKLSKVNEDYLKEYCDKNGNIKDTNMTKEEIKGLKSLKDRVKKGEISIAPTDKSGKLSINTRDNYINGLKSYVNNDIEISWNEKSEIKNILNAHSQQLARILMMGRNWGQHKGSTQH